MSGIIDMEEALRISRAYSYFGYRIIQGNTDNLKQIYGIVWKENPAIIEMISLLQDCITSVEIEDDRGVIYGPEFLYYWGMTCLGEQSSLVYRNIDIARNCFKKVVDIVPNAEARLAYIDLLDSDDPAKSEDNVKKIDTLRRWAGKQDLFSQIVLARIVFDHFLNELEETGLVEEEMEPKLPLRAMQLLQVPCRLGHPVAVRFRNEAIEYIESPGALKWKFDETCINAAVLYDYEPV